MRETDKKEINMIPGLRKRSPKAQQMMLDCYGDYVFAQVVRLVPRNEDAEEVYQDVFIKVFKNIDQYDEKRATLATWISRIAYNESINFLRRQQQTFIYLEDHEEETASMTEEEVEATLGHPDQETVQTIRHALRHLPPDERAIVTMFYYDEMSIKEIAYVTNNIPTTVASRLCRTRKKLCKIIKNIINNNERGHDKQLASAGQQPA